MASNVDPSMVGGLKPSETPAEDPTPTQPAASLIREKVDTGAPPPSSASEEQARVPSPACMEEPSNQTATPPDVPDQGKGLMAPPPL